jgi:hypothetical protein
MYIPPKETVVLNTGLLFASNHSSGIHLASNIHPTKTIAVQNSKKLGPESNEDRRLNSSVAMCKLNYGCPQRYRSLGPAVCGLQSIERKSVE